MLTRPKEIVALRNGLSAMTPSYVGHYCIGHSMGNTRGFLLTRQTQFLQQYDDAIRDFEKKSATAVRLATSPRDAQLVSQLRRHFGDMRKLNDRATAMAKDGQMENANESMLEAA